MAEYIDRQAAIDLAKDIIVPTESGYDYRHRCIDPQDLAELPAADVVKRKPLPEDVEELVKDLYGFAKECTDSDMCKDCQLAFMCEDGWPPNAIAHLIETWAATHKAMTERKTGKWLMPKNTVAVSLNEWICSSCNHLIDGKHNFCPNCGCAMEET